MTRTDIVIEIGPTGDGRVATLRLRGGATIRMTHDAMLKQGVAIGKPVVYDVDEHGNRHNPREL